jgi:hypothetical protein
MTQTITKAAREGAIQAAVEAAKQAIADGTGTAEEIRWKADKLVLPVASVALDMVLLSPHSHRIKAQLQSLPQSEQDVVATDPYGTPAQDIIARLLRETPGYERIKSAIANDGQLFAGVLTTGGVLVNANTRAVALRELRERYIKVVVLPADAGPREITELELQLQMEQEVKQEYSFTSQLLFIEDLINSNNYTTPEVGRRLRPALTTSPRDTRVATDLVEGELRLLGLVREVVGASGGVLTFLSFDDQRQALIEIDQDYQRLKTTRPDEAERVRDAQLAAMIAGVDYRRLREIDSALLDGYVAPALRESPALAPHVDALLSGEAADTELADTPSGVNDFFGDDDLPATPGQQPAGPSLSALYTLLARTRPEEDVALTVDDGEAVRLPRAVVAAELFSGLSTAIENKRRDSRQIDDLTAPMVHLKEAARLLDKAANAYSNVYGRASFDRAAFESAVREYERAAAAFAAIAEVGEDPSV